MRSEAVWFLSPPCRSATKAAGATFLRAMAGRSLEIAYGAPCERRAGLRMAWNVSRGELVAGAATVSNG
jgi:hypothetical protein